MITFVTALIDLKEDRTKDKSIETYFLHFNKIVNTGIKIHVFLSRNFQNIDLSRFENINIEYINLEELNTYKEIIDLELKLPENITSYHDTKNFMILINSKIELVKRAVDSNVFNSTHFAWIDFGINHVFKNPNTLNYLEMFGKTQFTKKFLLIPGCYPDKTRNATNIFNGIHWRFCGGFFIGDKESIIEFSNFYRDNFYKIIKANGILIWEVNMWAYLELNTDWKPTWIAADHNDSIIKIPSKYFDISVSLTTIPPRIANSCRKTINSLINQVDKIYLSIPKVYNRFGPSCVPDYLLNEPYKSKVIIIHQDRDFGPATKYIGGIDNINKNSWLFVCDDDQEYSKSIINDMFQSITNIGIYQNHFKHIIEKTSGGLIHGYVGLMIHSSLLENLKNFPLPESAYFVDDQWMSIFCFINNINIFPTILEYYKDIFEILQNNHEKIGICSLSEMNNRDSKVIDISTFFKVKFIKEKIYPITLS